MILFASKHTKTKQQLQAIQVKIPAQSTVLTSTHQASTAKYGRAVVAHRQGNARATITQGGVTRPARPGKHTSTVTAKSSSTTEWAQNASTCTSATHTSTTRNIANTYKPNKPESYNSIATKRAVTTLTRQNIPKQQQNVTFSPTKQHTNQAKVTPTQKHNYVKTTFTKSIHTFKQTTSPPTASLQQSNLFPASIPIQTDAGKLGVMWPRGAVANTHPAAHLLHFYSSKGCPVDTWDAWT